MKTLKDVLSENSIDCEIKWDGQTFSRNKSQWLICGEDRAGKRPYQWARFGDWKTGLDEKWNNLGEMTRKESKDFQEAMKKVKALTRADKEARWLSRAMEVEGEWGKFSETGRTAYMDKKQVNELYGSRIDGADLIVPMRDVNGKLWNYQRITPDKSSQGDKFFTWGCKVEGCFHALTGVRHKPTTIYIAEGFATAATLTAALRELASTDHMVVAAFNAGNLQSVATALHRNYGVPIVLCADNDVYTRDASNEPLNVGINKATHAAASVGGQAVWPTFKEPREGLTDFNDLHKSEGLAEVARQVLEFKPPADLTIQPLELAVTNQGVVKKPSETAVVEHLMKYFGATLLQQDGNIFQYKDGWWQEFEGSDTSALKRLIHSVSAGSFGHRDVENCYRLLFNFIPHPVKGRSLYRSNPYLTNFTNGTIHLESGSSVTFKDHNPLDYCTNILPFDCPAIGDVYKNGSGEPVSLPPAPMFDAWLERLWAGDPDKASKIKLYHQLMGACLCPAYPTITLFIGKPNCGKSTLVKMLVKLVDLKNTSQVQLSDMDGFHMTSMVNKLVNFNTEMELRKPIRDVAVKMIIDRMPFSVQRKYQSNILAYLPAVHLFAANDTPASLDGHSQAYGRRIIIVKTDSLGLTDNEGRYDFEQELWEAEKDGIVARGVCGLIELHKNKGKFERPESSAEHVNALQTGSDIVAQFLEFGKNDDLGLEQPALVFGEKCMAKPGELWLVFDTFQQGCVGFLQRIGKHEFYKRIRSRGFGTKGIAGEDTFRGIALNRKMPKATESSHLKGYRN